MEFEKGVVEFEKGVVLGNTAVDDVEEAITTTSDVVGDGDESTIGDSDVIGDVEEVTTATSDVVDDDNEATTEDFDVIGDGETSGSVVLDTTAGAVDAGDIGVEDDPKAEETLGVADATAAVDDFSLSGFSFCEPPQILPVGFPQPLPPATGHHSGSGSLGDQSVIGGLVTKSYFGL